MTYLSPRISLAPPLYPGVTLPVGVCWEGEVGEEPSVRRLRQVEELAEETSVKFNEERKVSRVSCGDCGWLN